MHIVKNRVKKYEYKFVNERVRIFFRDLQKLWIRTVILLETLM